MFLWGKHYLAQRREPLQWIVQDLIPVGGKANLFGKPKTMKSFMALQMASAIASGEKEFLGLSIEKHGPVAYIQIDTAGSVWFDRVKKQADAVGMNFDNVAFADTDTGTPFPLNIHADAPAIKEHLQAIKPILIIWDTIRELHPGDENESSVMKNVVSAMVGVGMGPLDANNIPEWRSAHLIISHRKKENANYTDDIRNANRGSSYIAGACDSVIQLSETSMEYISRSAESAHKKIVFDKDDLLWKLDESEEKILKAVEGVLMELPPYPRDGLDRERARRIAEKCGITEDSARGHLRRKKKQLSPKLVKPS